MTAAESAVPHDLKIPDVRGLSLKQAALRYAEAGFYVLPVAHGKHPGSIVGKFWPDKSSTDADQIEDWWEEKPEAGIAIHTGASGMTFFDLDKDALPNELAFLATGIVQFSRAEFVNSERGHYGFFTGDEIFTSGRLKLADGTHVGEIKSGNSVIIASPSKHVDEEAENGQYRWREGDVGTPIPKLPSEARKYLRLLGIKKPADGTHTAMAGWCVEATDDAVREAAKEWQSEVRPKALLNLVNWVKSADAGTRDRTRDALRIAAGESRLGFFPLADAINQLHDAEQKSYNRRGEPDKLDEGDFTRLVKNGVGYALNRELGEIADEANRDYAEGDFEDEVEKQVRWLEIRAEAKRRFDSKDHKPFSRTPMSLTERLKQPRNPTPIRIDNLMQDHGLVLLAAQYKAGKTTSVYNLIRSLVDGDPFLDVFTVRKTAKRLVLIDTEMSEDLVLNWLSQQGVKNTDAVADVICLRGQVADFDILNEKRRGEWAAHLREIGCDYLILDCLSPVLEAIGLDENHDIGKFLIAFRALLAEAGIDSDSAIAHHMGHTGERARGDSKLPGGADAIWKIVLKDPNDSMSQRYFSALGRDVEVAEGLVDYDPATRHLKYKALSRADAKKQDKLSDAVKQILSALKEDQTNGGIGISQNKLIEEVRKKTGIGEPTIKMALQTGVDERSLVTFSGENSSKIYALDPNWCKKDD